MLVAYVLLAIGQNSLSQNSLSQNILSRGSIPQGSIRIHPGDVLTTSTKVAQQVYALPPAKHLRIEGSDLVIDFNGATIRGSSPETEPDQRDGTGIEVSGKNITIKNLKVRGYKVGLLARNVAGLTLEHCDFSYNWKQRLKSTPDKEDESDWMSYHHNEADEWLRYGAAVYLNGCDRFLVSRCRATGGECGLMLTRCNHGRVLGNNFSYLSGVGLGMYRSSDNLVQQNKLDYCVRGYSHGVYYRGQDSTGILVYEQSHRNTFAYNSVTHGGDGFFLWAGQSTVDTGEGGCNDNLVYGNDFSHAVANGIEATFSRNTFRNNLLAQCWHGIWGGYSFDSLFKGNTMIGDLSGIAIEHGQNNKIEENLMIHDRVDLELWGKPETDPSFGYAKHRDTHSRNVEISRNTFIPCLPTPDLDVRDTTDVRWIRNEGSAGVRLTGNQPVPGLLLLNPGPEVPKPVWGKGLEFETRLSAYHDFENWEPFHAPGKRAKDADAVPVISGYPLPFITKGQPRGRDTIVVDEWGPYDRMSPRLTLARTEKGSRFYRIDGPDQRKTDGGLSTWAVDYWTNGRILSPLNGIIPSEIVFQPRGAGGYPIELAVRYKGPKTIDYKGNEHPENESISLVDRAFVTNLDWDVCFYKWDKATDPRQHLDAFTDLLDGVPIVERHADQLQYDGSGPWAEGVPADYFAIKATTNLQFQPETYIMEVTSDDGVRVALDDVPIQLLDANESPANAFKYQGPTTYHTELVLDGKPHLLLLEYFQIDGAKTLKVSFRLKPHEKEVLPPTQPSS